MAQLNGTDFLAKWATLFADNTTGDISAEDMRDFRQDITDSFLNSVTPVTIGTAAGTAITPSNVNSGKSSTSATGNTLNGMFYVDQTVATTGGPQGVEGFVETSNSSGTVVLSIGAVGNVQHSGAGTLSYGRSVQAGGILSSNGTITDLSGLFSTYAITGSGTISTYYGAYLETPSAGSGTITNRYGLYSQDPNAINYFGGSIRMNSISQDDALTQLIVRDSSTGQLKYRAASTFQPALSGYTAGRVIFANSPTSFTTDAGFEYDNSANKLTVSDIDTNGMSADILSINSNTTLTASHYTVLVNAASGNVTITLPDIPGAAGVDNGRIYVIKKIDSSVNTVTIDADSSDNIDGAATYVLTGQYDSVMIQAIPTNTWNILASH